MDVSLRRTIVSRPFPLRVASKALRRAPIRASEESAFRRRVIRRDTAKRATVVTASTEVEQRGRRGKCWLVGSGPGAADLMSIRGARLIGQAEVVIYDELGAEDLLEEYAAPGSKRIYVGKRGGRPSITQTELNALLVDACVKGRRVVRLKGGCPSVFSRCSEELDALAAAGIEVELVPGISSALSAPLFAGFPLTEKQVGRHFVVTSAHDPGLLNWEHLAAIDTIVILMGGAALPEIVQLLSQADRDACTPVVVVRWAGTPKQRVWRGRLDDIVKVTASEVLSPCVIVIGEVASRAYQP